MCVRARAHVCTCGHLERALEANQTALPALAVAHEPASHDEVGGTRGRGTGWWGEEERWTGVFHGETGLLRSSPLSRLAAMNAVGEGEECARARGKGHDALCMLMQTCMHARPSVCCMCAQCLCISRTQSCAPHHPIIESPPCRAAALCASADSAPNELGSSCGIHPALGEALCLNTTMVRTYRTQRSWDLCVSCRYAAGGPV